MITIPSWRLFAGAVIIGIGVTFVAEDARHDERKRLDRKVWRDADNSSVGSMAHADFQRDRLHTTSDPA